MAATPPPPGVAVASASFLLLHSWTHQSWQGSRVAAASALTAVVCRVRLLCHWSRQGTRSRLLQMDPSRGRSVGPDDYRSVVAPTLTGRVAVAHRLRLLHSSGRRLATCSVPQLHRRASASKEGHFTGVPRYAGASYTPAKASSCQPRRPSGARLLGSSVPFIPATCSLRASHPLPEHSTNSPNHRIQTTGRRMAAKTVDGSALAGRALAAAGARHMFGVVGIPVTSLASRAAAAGVRFLAFHNEQSAGYAAAAYGFLTGTPGLLLTVSGPGCVHGLAGVSHATANAWPLLMVSGSCDQADAGRGDFQELDQIAATKPFAKLAVKATTIADIPHLVFQALAAATSGRPGGCYLDIPSDVLHQTIPESEAVDLIAAATAESAASNPAPPKQNSLDEGIQKAADLLRRAERPLVVIGKGAAYARAEEAIRKLVDTTGIPFLPTPMGKGVVPDSHPLSATAARSLAIGQCDVALVVGARLNWLLHFGEPPKWSKDVKFILVDVCEEEIELRKPHVGIVGDAKRVVELINMEIKDDPFCLARSHPWVEAITKKAKDNVLRMEAQLAKDVVPFNFLTPLRIIRDAILAEGSPAPIVVSEGANTMDVGRAVLVQNEPRTRLDAGTWGTMGVGLGYCIAAAVAEPERLVVAVEGDSGFGFSAMEVETLVRYQLPVVVIVFNNNGVYGGDRRGPDEITGPYKDDPAPTSFVPAAGYDKMMEAFGGKGYLVQTPDELKSALSESFRARKPAVINCIIDPYAGSESGRMQHKN